MDDVMASHEYGYHVHQQIPNISAHDTFLPQVDLPSASGIRQQPQTLRAVSRKHSQRSEFSFSPPILSMKAGSHLSPQRPLLDKTKPGCLRPGLSWIDLPYELRVMIYKFILRQIPKVIDIAQPNAIAAVSDYSGLWMLCKEAWACCKEEMWKDRAIKLSCRHLLLNCNNHNTALGHKYLLPRYVGVFSQLRILSVRVEKIEEILCPKPYFHYDNLWTAMARYFKYPAGKKLHVSF